ncbi:hypothetical protein [Thermohalobacter berrensis]|uniref:Uncharacterized protein n=1 Tax=Thermohalobacter berrensis TaxID=99594 RepID=A0A419SZ80_9FIRM|nr:hypothetical protein [Thermohalobacter berrensis]RKD30501.1 hypothetical protein BET03_03955 [Thermohalobacter berrensis]
MKTIEQFKKVNLILMLLLVFLLSSCTPKNLETDISKIKFNDIEFVEQYNNIRKRLNLTNNAKLQNLYITFDKDYYITLLQYELIDFGVEDKFKIYHITLNGKGNKYEIQTTESDTWLQFDQLISAEEFFHIVKNIDITNIIGDNNASYYDIFATGKYEIDATNSSKRYIIEKSKIINVESKETVKGYYIDVIDDKSIRIGRFFFGK